MTLTYSLAQREQGELVIFDLTGRIVSRYPLTSENNQFKITDGALSTGVYMYKVMIDGRMVKSGKLVTTR